MPSCRAQVGLWAQKHVPAMDMPALRAFADVLNVDNPDLFKWLTGQEQPADGVAGNPSFQVGAALTCCQAAHM